MFGKKSVNNNYKNYVFREVSGDENSVEKAKAVATNATMAYNVQRAIESMDETIHDLFYESEFIQETIDELYGENWNKKSYQERVQIFANIALCCSQVFGEDVIKDGVKVTSHPVNGESIVISEGELYMAKELFEQEFAGITNLTNFIYEFRKYMIILLTNGAMAVEVMPSELKGLARVYYENATESVLENSWSNFRTKDDKDYYNQPIIIDSTKLSIDYAFNYMKMLYKKYHKIDSEFSVLANSRMSFYDCLDELKKRRTEIAKQNRKNVDGYDTDLDNYERYLQVTLSDLSSLSDDEFFELLNNSYYMALNTDYDGMLVKRLENICNELPKRVFADFDLEGIELTKYSFKFDPEECIMDLVYERDGEVISEAVEDSSQIFTSIIGDIANLARQNMLVKFNNDQEKQDWIDMNRWYNLKQNDLSAQDRKVMNDGLNIILTKISEVIEEMCKKIDIAIEKSSFLPHGASMIRSDDRESIYDYYEYKNGLTKEEVRARLMKYVRDDLKKIESRGGR